MEEDTELAGKTFSAPDRDLGFGKGTTFYNALDTLITEKINSPLKIRVDQVFHLMRRLAEDSELYKITGGTHNSALATAEDLVLFRTDIGRHNAVDQVSGNAS